MYLINERNEVVADAVEGVVLASGGKLTRLDGFPHIRVVLRTDWNKDKVALISGGGSGHEPAHAGFVGKGMLTAAVCGDIFASPSVEAVLAAILAVTGSAGCLLIVKNYTGDRLNFGLAAERARQLGYKVEMVVVDDDVALPDIAHARGLAGTLFVHKIVGAQAEGGATLEEIYQNASDICKRLSTIGLSLDTCTVPGAEAEDRIAENSAELGLGIHGEPGASQIACTSASDAIEALRNAIGALDVNKKYVALMNNLGTTTALEMSVLTKTFYDAMKGYNISHIVGPAALMTSLDMHGFSISLMEIRDDYDLKWLAEPTDCSAWPGCKVFERTEPVEMSKALQFARPKPSKNATTLEMLNKVTAAIINSEADLNALDAKIGDGDTGATFAGAARAILAQIDELPLDQQAELFETLSHILERTMGGSSGVLGSIFFAATSDALKSGDNLNEALLAGLARMQEIGGASLGDRTMVDALSPALNALKNGANDAAQAARKGANDTAQMQSARAGRAAYVSSTHLEGQIDPGAEAIARIFEAIAS